MRHELDGELVGKVAVVTGGASGIGFGSAMLLAARGATVIIGDVGRDRVESAVEQLSAAGSAAGMVADVTDDVTSRP